MTYHENTPYFSTSFNCQPHMLSFGFSLCLDLFSVPLSFLLLDGLIMRSFVIIIIKGGRALLMRNSFH